MVAQAVASSRRYGPGAGGESGGEPCWPIARTASSSRSRSSLGGDPGGELADTISTWAIRSPKARTASSPGCGGGSQANSTRNDSSVREGALVASSLAQAWPAIGTRSTSHSA